MPVSPQLAKWLTENGYDAVHASDITYISQKIEKFSKKQENRAELLSLQTLIFPSFLQ